MNVMVSIQKCRSERQVFKALRGLSTQMKVDVLESVIKQLIEESEVAINNYQNELAIFKLSQLALLEDAQIKLQRYVRV